jgi:flagella basal body P-ring formation protein FlgA
MRFLVSILWVFAGSALAECSRTAEDVVRAGDVAQQEPLLASLPENFVLGFAPRPGLVRRFDPWELRRAFLKTGVPVSGSLHAVCVERVRTILKVDAIEEAARTAVPAGWRIAIEQAGPPDADQGAVSFTKQSFDLAEPRPNGSWLIRGRVKADGRTTGVWVVARLEREGCVARAVRSISRGELVTAESITDDCGVLAWDRTRNASVGEATGQMAARNLKLGQRLTQVDLASPYVIEKGAPMKISSSAGTAAVQIEANAPARARVGDVMTFRNPVNGRSLKARVSAANRAEVMQ